MRIALALFVCLLSHAHASDPRRIYSHLLIHDFHSACQEAEQAIKSHPEQKELWIAYIDALAKAGEEKKMMEVWNQFSTRFPDCFQRDILENMAWSIIEKSSYSSSQLIRATSLLGAFFGQDAKGIKIIRRLLHDPNAIVRSMAVQLSGEMRDSLLSEEIYTLFQKEKNWDVRQELIHALGKMHVKKAKSDLIAIIADEQSMAEEKGAAIESLLAMTDVIERQEVVRLASSDRTGLRELACQIVCRFSQLRDLDLLVRLLNDRNSAVRTAAVQSIGVLRPVNHPAFSPEKHLLPMLKDRDRSVAISAAWVLTLYNCEEAQAALLGWLKNEDPETRRLASGALALSGKFSLPLIFKMLGESDDPYVKMNLAKALIRLRHESDKACEVLYENLSSNKERWQWQGEGVFSFLAPNPFSLDNDPENAEAGSQMIHLEFLNLIAIMQYPKALDAVKAYLKEKQWGITGIASALLLTEGDEAAIDLVKKILYDSNQQIRIQAALILALWGRDQTAITTLQEAYPLADRELKEKILEGLGRIGSSSSLPFLTKQLDAPYPSLRIIAASSVLQCLYH